MDITQNIDEAAVTKLVKTILDILDNEEQLVEMDDAHAYQIKEYLTLLDLIMEVDLLIANCSLKTCFLGLASFISSRTMSSIILPLISLKMCSKMRLRCTAERALNFSSSSGLLISSSAWA